MHNKTDNFIPQNMSVKNTGDIYICKKCGNEVIITKVGGGVLFCCEKEMILIDEDNNEMTEEMEDSEE